MSVNKEKINGRSNLTSYLAVSVGVGCIGTFAQGAVTFYGVASANDTNPDPAGIDIGDNLYLGVLFYADAGYSVSSYFGVDGGISFTNGGDLASSAGLGGSIYTSDFGVLQYGASSGSLNYANVSFDGNDNVYEAVAQFYLDGMGGGYLIAVATTNPMPNPSDLSGVGGPALSISAGKALIDAAVPEPSSLVLLALGAVGLAARRRRKKVA